MALVLGLCVFVCLLWFDFVNVIGYDAWFGYSGSTLNFSFGFCVLDMVALWRYFSFFVWVWCLVMLVTLLSGLLC